MANEKGPQGRQQMQAPRRKYFGQKFFQQISIITISSYLPSFSHSLHRYPKLISRVSQGSKDHNRGKDAELKRDVNVMMLNFNAKGLGNRVSPGEKVHKGHNMCINMNRCREPIRKYVQ